ncbi:MAG: glycoside hydrolase family 16 protein [Candidatus Izemoplasmatales bacterium]|jgi:beta-glucanase (GH16 family)|nr:glycoside hydrolase family 16 protein [Candidatus Izemoplasmatales bacterium]
MKTLLDLDFTKIKELPRDIFNVQVGDKWANKELQHYVDDEEHISFTDDGLVILATYKNGVYESARINTKGKFAFLYGQIDIVAKLPLGKGTWPALWMMSDDNRYGFWPRSGEIDIMEHVGWDPGKLLLCIHTEKYNHRNKEQYYTNLEFPKITEGFHKYSLNWQEGKIIYLLDNEEVARYEKGHNGFDTTEKGWPFDHPYYFLINLAIGGVLGKDPDPSVFPQKFIIKSIKVTQE